MATHSSVPAWRVPWTEESAGPPSMGLQRAGQDEAAEHATAISPQPRSPAGQPQHGHALLASTTCSDLWLAKSSEPIRANCRFLCLPPGSAVQQKLHLITFFTNQLQEQSAKLTRNNFMLSSNLYFLKLWCFAITISSYCIITMFFEWG